MAKKRAAKKPRTKTAMKAPKKATPKRTAAGGKKKTGKCGGPGCECDKRGRKLGACGGCCGCCCGCD